MPTSATGPHLGIFGHGWYQDGMEMYGVGVRPSLVSHLYAVSHAIRKRLNTALWVWGVDAAAYNSITTTQCHEAPTLG